MVAAADSFFRQKSVEILTPASEALQRDLEAIATRKGRLDQEIGEKQEECRRLKNEIEQAGGERLRQIPLLIQNHQSHVDTKRARSHRYHEALREAGIHDEVVDQPSFATVQARTPSLLHDISQQITKHSEGRDALVLECGGIKATLRNEEGELRALRSVKETCRNGWPR